MNLIVIPLFTTVADMMPQMKHLPQQGHVNAKNWSEYVENEEDKKIYLPKVKEEAQTSLLHALEEGTSEGLTEGIAKLDMKIDSAGSREANSK